MAESPPAFSPAWWTRCAAIVAVLGAGLTLWVTATRAVASDAAKERVAEVQAEVQAAVEKTAENKQAINDLRLQIEREFGALRLEQAKAAADIEHIKSDMQKTLQMLERALK